jgi:hypothetical protein
LTVSVTFSTDLGGSGDTYSDGTGVGGMAQGGHRLYFFPMMQDYIAVAAHTESNAQLAADYAASAANAPGTNATTATSVTVSTGSKNITLSQTNKQYSKGQRINIASSANALNSVSGVITAFTSSDGTMTVNVDGTSGSGSFSDGIVSLSASAGVPATRTITPGGLLQGGGNLASNLTISLAEALASDIRVGTSKTKVPTPGDVTDALAVVNLQFGANITTSGDSVLDFSKFKNGFFVASGNFFLPNPTNHQPGMSGRIAVQQDSIGNRAMSDWGTFYRAEGGQPQFSTTPNTIDYLYFDVVSANVVVASLIKGPTN